MNDLSLIELMNEYNEDLSERDNMINKEIY